MQTALKNALGRLSLSRPFVLSVIATLVLGAAIGTWMAKQIATSKVNDAATNSAVYMESIFAAQLHDWPRGEQVSEEAHAELDRIFLDGQLHHEVLRFKLWDPGGYIYYSSDHAQTGLRFPVEGMLATAFAGKVQARLSKLDEKDNLPELARWPRLLEVYVPIRSGSGKVIAVAELYLSAQNVENNIHAHLVRLWMIVAFITFAICLLLYNLHRLYISFKENARMHEQLRQAGEGMTTLNEEILLRIAADLHDGPAQTIAYALMRFNEFTAMCRGCPLAPDGVAQELHRTRSALQSSLQEVRKISSGLAVPGMTELSLYDTARRAVLDFERISGVTVETGIDKSLDKAPLALKITVYRLLQESLNNCRQHAPGGEPRVRVQHCDGNILITVTDQGSGFDPQAAAAAGRLGLAFMRERVRLLGGVFEIDSAPGRGTCVRARLPLPASEVIHA
ncbi:MAG TPA: ATP-binding protein [Gallionella sp.]|nr:ATP-binding protein [Gallionella sp.]